MSSVWGVCVVVGGKEALPDRLCLTRSLLETKNSAHASLVFFTDCNYFLRQKVPHTEELEWEDRIPVGGWWGFERQHICNVPRTFIGTRIRVRDDRYILKEENRTAQAWRWWGIPGFSTWFPPLSLFFNFCSAMKPHPSFFLKVMFNFLSLQPYALYVIGWGRSLPRCWISLYSVGRGAVKCIFT